MNMGVSNLLVVFSRILPSEFTLAVRTDIAIRRVFRQLLATSAIYDRMY
jgi:hypothetical protein